MIINSPDVRRKEEVEMTSYSIFLNGETEEHMRRKTEKNIVNSTTWLEI